MAVLILLQDRKNDDFIDMKEMLLRTIRENLHKVTIHEKADFTKYEHVVYIGFNLKMIADLFNRLTKQKNKLYLYNLPGYSPYEYIKKLVDECVYHGYDLDRYHNRILDTWNYREIYDNLAVDYRTREQYAAEQIEKRITTLNSINNEDLPDEQILIGDTTEDYTQEDFIV